MKVILTTFVICAIVVYVYFDYDNLKKRFFGEEEVIKQKQEKVIKKDEPKKDETIKTETETKFKEGDEVYINASVGDLALWKQTKVPAWVTYHGSPHDSEQRIKEHFNHREEVKIIHVAIGSENKVWYYVRTPKGFPISGWVEEIFLSKEPPPRISNQPPDRGM